jgi:hypothetical protein
MWTIDSRRSGPDQSIMIAWENSIVLWFVHRIYIYIYILQTTFSNNTDTHMFVNIYKNISISIYYIVLLSRNDDRDIQHVVATIYIYIYIYLFLAIEH